VIGESQPRVRPSFVMTALGRDALSQDISIWPKRLSIRFPSLFWSGFGSAILYKFGPRPIVSFGNAYGSLTILGFPIKE
jgi:hypothetical protein